MITIVNYGIGNLASMLNMLNRVGVKASIEESVENIAKAQKLILPGVGSFDNAMNKINKKEGLKDILQEKVIKEKVPILGVCLGMQLLTYSSEEGNISGFGWIPGRTKRLRSFDNNKVPHMGWNLVVPQSDNPLVKNLEQGTRFYFTHSYYVELENQSFSLMKTNYGIEFESGICMGNIYGVQFHPEKSHRYGMKFLENFSKV